ncbi:MAG TPA: methyltransferase domain-containing protein [Caulobacteraceae bacterium]
MSTDYEYRGLMAEAWDLLRGDTSGWEDRAWFRTVIEREGGGPALDVGCGTGRLLLDYLAAGLDVDGVDDSPEMLALCRAKAKAAGLDVTARLHCAQMQALALPRRYATIFVPSLAILLLPAPGEIERALNAFRAHLLEGGRLALSFRAFRMWDGPGPAPADDEWSDWWVDAEAARADGAVVRRWTRFRSHDAQQLVDEVFRYEVIRDGVVVRSELQGHTPTLRWYSLEQAMSLVEAAGFTDLSATWKDTFEPARSGARTFKIVAVRS